MRNGSSKSWQFAMEKIGDCFLELFILNRFRHDFSEIKFSFRIRMNRAYINSCKTR